MVTILTKHSGILGPVAVILGYIMNAIYEFFNLFGIQNIALAIFIFTFIARALMLPLTIKQQKFTKLSSKMNPELQKIQAKYKGKKDEVSLRKQQEETQAVYQKYGANPASGCFPVLIQMPIMFTLYYIIGNIPAYVGKVKDMYEPVALKISNAPQYKEIITEIAKGNSRIRVSDLSTTNKIIDALAQFNGARWDQLAAQFPDFSSTITNSWEKIGHVNSFFGMNIANPPGFTFPAILIPIIAAGLQFISGKQLQSTNKDMNKDNPAASAMNSMNVVMPIMSLFFCFSFNIGIGLYWIAGSIFAIVQQFFVNKYMDHVNVDELIEKNLAKASKRKPHQIETNGLSLQDLAKRQTKSISNNTTVSEKAKNTEKPEINEKQDDSNEKESQTESQASDGKKSISEIANLLKNRN